MRCKEKEYRLATIVDVARMAGVSTMTVSRVINNKSLVGEATCQKVIQAIDALSYVPNSAARSLVSRQNKAIAVLIASVVNPYYGLVMEGIESIAEANGYSVLLINANQQEKYRSCIDNVIGRGVSGFISSHLNLHQAHIDKLLKHGIKCVLIDNEQDLDGIASIKSDHRFGASVAVEHLIGLGHSRIGFIHGNLGQNLKDDAHGKEEKYSFNLWRLRYEGYMETVLKHGLQIPREYIIQGDASIEANVHSGMVAMDRLMNLSSPPTAVYAGNDLFAIGALNAVLHRGFKVPRDFSIIGHGGIDATKYTFPILTCVKQPRFEIGCHAASMVMDLIEGKDHDGLPLASETVRPSLVPGGSTGPVA
jgi:DNA-binding LacI/PurR family transcriptional regulator